MLSASVGDERVAVVGDCCGADIGCRWRRGREVFRLAKPPGDFDPFRNIGLSLAFGWQLRKLIEVLHVQKLRATQPEFVVRLQRGITFRYGRVDGHAVQATQIPDDPVRQLGEDFRVVTATQIIPQHDTIVRRATNGVALPRLQRMHVAEAVVTALNQKPSR